MKRSYRRAETNRDKEEVMRRLLVAWKCRPELRLGQLIVNVAGGDPFFIEDFDLVQETEEFIKDPSKKG